MKMKIIKKRSVSKALMKPLNPSLIVILGAYTTVWGLWLLSPFWHVFTRAPLYSAMEGVAPEWAWGLLAFASGIAIIYGFFGRHPQALIRGAVIGYFHWGLNSIFYFLGDWKNTGGVTSLTFAIYSFVVYLNLKKNYKWHGEIDEIQS